MSASALVLCPVPGCLGWVEVRMSVSVRLDSQDEDQARPSRPLQVGVSPQSYQCIGQHSHQPLQGEL